MYKTGNNASVGTGIDIRISCAGREATLRSGPTQFMRWIQTLTGKLKQSLPAGLAYVLAQRLGQPRRLRRLVVFPEQMYTGTAGDLRGWAIARELRKRGWRTIVVPPWLDLRHRLMIVRQEMPDLILLQQSRHPLNRPALYPGIPCVFDADDADILNAPALVAECLRGCRAAIAGSRFLAHRFRQFNARVSIVWTGSYLSPAPRAAPNKARGPVIAWAHSDPFSYLPEAHFVRDLVVRLALQHDHLTFCFYGAEDEAAAEDYLSPIRAAGVEVKAFPPLRYRRFVQTLENAAIGLHPIAPENPWSQGKSFGKLLAYMVANVAIVTSSAADHPLFFQHGHNGMLAGSIDEWVACCGQLLSDPAMRARMVQQACSDFSRRLTTARAAELVDAVLTRVLDETQPTENTIIRSQEWV